MKKTTCNQKKIDTKNTYQKVKLHATPSRHLQIIAKINGVKGYFIVDTGASNSCIDIKKSDKYLINPKKSKEKTIGAGHDVIETYTSDKINISIGKKHLKIKKLFC